MATDGAVFDLTTLLGSAIQRRNRHLPVAVTAVLVIFAGFWELVRTTGVPVILVFGAIFVGAAALGLVTVYIVSLVSLPPVSVEVSPEGVECRFIGGRSKLMTWGDWARSHTLLIWESTSRAGRVDREFSMRSGRLIPQSVLVTSELVTALRSEASLAGFRERVLSWGSSGGDSGSRTGMTVWFEPASLHTVIP